MNQEANVSTPTNQEGTVVYSDELGSKCIYSDITMVELNLV